MTDDDIKQGKMIVELYGRSAGRVYHSAVQPVGRASLTNNGGYQGCQSIR
ncbi:hypothetical protein KVG95_21335 [Pseudomonas sp. SWRI79]|uniref:Uncharacterized protein n=1 Tax=Pseudomonas farris TaxID=2841207 RepID=A0ABS6PZI6_9PSED|nr:hypothetical protein [Pseudomonas farris]MBV4465875.1 hypothetical protein [Pseudomonas farris]